MHACAGKARVFEFMHSLTEKAKATELVRILALVSVTRVREFILQRGHGYERLRIQALNFATLVVPPWGDAYEKPLELHWPHACQRQ